MRQEEHGVIKMDVILLGIDGLEPSLVREWRDDLPTLASLADDGVEAEIRSSDPPFTVPAWPTLYTGKQGGKHGAFTFEKRVEDSYEYTPINYSDVHAQSLWEVLDEQGISCGVVNVPLTYPPSELDHGYVVPGWPAPRRELVCPDEDVAELLQDLSREYEVNPYPTTFDLKQVDEDRLVDQICDGLLMRNEAFSRLLSETDLDFFFGVYMGIDIASHSLAWHEEHLKEVYVHQDRLLDDLLEEMNEQTDVVLVSDHGHAQQSEYSFHVNEWLRQQGYLSIDESKETSQLFRKLGITQERYAALRSRLRLGDVHEWLPGPLFRMLKRIVPEEDGTVDFEEVKIDWEETTAYAPVQNEIYLNRTDREPSGTVGTDECSAVVDDICSALESVDHPERDEPLLSDLHRCDELFHGPYSTESPEIVFTADDMACNVSKGFDGNELFSEIQWGEHRQYGLLVASGPSINLDAGVETPQLHDVFSTVLALLDARVPEDADGRVITGLFESDPKVEYGTLSRDDNDDAKVYDDDESEEVKDQLRGLGYLE